MEEMIRSGELPDLSRIEDIESILVIRLKALGDIALSLPIPRALKERFPDSRISYLCWEQYVEALRGEGSIDEVIELRRGITGQIGAIRRLRKRRFDLAIDLLGSPRSALLTLLSGARIRIGMDVGRHNWCYHFLIPRVMLIDGERVKCYTLDSNRHIIRMLGLRPVGERAGTGGDRSERAGSDGCAIGFPAAETEKEWARDYISGLGLERKRLVGVIPAATYQSKSWPVEGFVQLGRMMKERFDLVSLVLWGPGEEERARWVARSIPGAVCAPETGIARLGALISQLRLLVTTDSGPKHLAVLQGVPTITLFGPTDPVIWDPMNDSHDVLYLGAPCAPCKKSSCRPNRCLSDIEPEDVMRKIAIMIGMEEAPMRQREE